MNDQSAGEALGGREGGREGGRGRSQDLKTEKRATFSIIFDAAEKTQKCTGVDPFPKRHRLIHNSGFTEFEALYCSLNMVNSTEIS